LYIEYVKQYSRLHFPSRLSSESIMTTRSKRRVDALDDDEKRKRRQEQNRVAQREFRKR